MEKKDDELIAEFMGEEISAVIANYGVPIRVLVLPKKPISERRSGRPIEVKYSTSLDWLRPVAVKFVEIAKATDMPHHLYMNVATFAVIRPTEELYENLVKGIKWYNNGKDR